MKLNTVLKALSKFKSVQDLKGNTYYYSRDYVSSSRYRLIKVSNQSANNCIALPIFEDSEGVQEVAFHAKTVKSLIEFLEGK